MVLSSIFHLLDDTIETQLRPRIGGLLPPIALTFAGFRPEEGADEIVPFSVSVSPETVESAPPAQRNDDRSRTNNEGCRRTRWALAERWP